MAPMRRCWVLSLLLLAACPGPSGPTPAVLAALAAQADPAGWEDQGSVRPGQRRDPRTGITFVQVPAGEFVMGGAVMPLEQPPHRVRLSRDWLLADTEVTVGQWRVYVERHGGAWPGPVPPSSADALPMTGVHWHDAAAFCARYGYRLPTEAEWERACRGGLPDEAGPWRDETVLQQHAWFHMNAAERGVQPVGNRLANAYGLHDMLGNVWEWTGDWVARYPADDAVTVDPVAPPCPPGGLQGKVLRGGSWFTMPGPEPSTRMPIDPGERSDFYGFRPAADPRR